MRRLENDTAAMREHLRWLAHGQAGGCTQLELRRGGTARSFHADVDSLIEAAIGQPESAVNVGVNPRPAAWAGSGFRECGSGSIEAITAVRIDIDCCRPMALASEALIRCEFEADARRRAEQGKSALDLAPMTIAIAARCAAGTPGLLAGVEEHKGTLRHAIDAACRAESLQLRPELLDRLVTYANRAAASQPTSDAEHEQAIEAGKRLAQWAREQGFGEALIVDSGNGAHVWFPVDAIRLDPKNREAIALGCAELERLCRIEIEAEDSPLRVDPWGGFAATTRLAGCPNRKGHNTPERAHRLSCIIQGAERAGGAALSRWLASEGGAIQRRLQEERARADDERRARVAANPMLEGQGLRNLDKRVDGAVAGFIENHPLSGVGHNETLRNLLALARMLVWELDLTDAEPRFRDLVAAHCDSDHWSARQFELELAKALRKADSATGARGTRGSLIERWAQEDEREQQTRRARPLPRKQVASTQPERAQEEPAQKWHSAPHLHAVEPGESLVFNDDACLPQHFYDPVADVPMATAPKRETWWLPILPDPPTHRRDVANHGVAEFVREYLDRHLPGLIMYDRDAFWIYAEGCWRQVPDSWMENIVRRFHNRVRSPNPTAKQDWDANVTNIKSVISLLRLMMTEDQWHEDATGGGILSRSACLAVFGANAIHMHEGRPCIGKTVPSLRARHAYPFEYAEGLQPANLLRVMREDWFRGVEESERERRIQCLREFIGHCLLGSLPIANIHKMLICVGNGNDGKSVLMDIVRACMPPGSCSSINLQSLESGACGGEFNRAALEGKMANLIDDMSAATIAESAAFKSAVTFAPIEARQIKQAAFTFTPKAAWWGNVNPTNGRLPKLEGQSGGMMRRLLCIEFPNSVRQGKETRDLSDRILGLEMREFVCWAVEAALDMLTEGRTAFTTPACHERILDIWRAGSLGEDPVSEFVRYACRRVENESEWSIANSELYPQFDSWINAMGGPERDRSKCAFNVFMRRLRSAGVVVRRTTRAKKQVHIANIRVQESTV
jgi:P4 family phage/plasmid primase-like protien